MQMTQCCKRETLRGQRWTGSQFDFISVSNLELQMVPLSSVGKKFNSESHPFIEQTIITARQFLLATEKSSWSESKKP